MIRNTHYLWISTIPSTVTKNTWDMDLNGIKSLIRSGKVSYKNFDNVWGPLMKLWLYKIIKPDIIKWVKKT